jgi:hypothetical protein
MTLVDDCERLTTLAEQADAAADAGSAEAALREVLERLNLAGRSIAYGVREPHWWEHVPEPARPAVRAAAQRAAAAVTPLSTESDQVLAAYGRGGTTMDRGALAALFRAFTDYGTALREAQNQLLRAWSEELWPSDRQAELDVHAIVPDTAAAAREVLSVTSELADAAGDRLLDSAALQRTFDRCQAAQASAAALRRLPLPPPVLQFFTRIAQDEVLLLSDIEAEVIAWLDRHDATRLFSVSRADA